MPSTSGREQLIHGQAREGDAGLGEGEQRQDQIGDIRVQVMHGLLQGLRASSARGETGTMAAKATAASDVLTDRPGRVSHQTMANAMTQRGAAIRRREATAMTASSPPAQASGCQIDAALNRTAIRAIAPEIVDDRQGQQEDPQGRGQAGPGQGEDGEREGDVCRKRDRPAVGRFARS
jgi:hypothetical protein